MVDVGSMYVQYSIIVAGGGCWINEAVRENTELQARLDTNVHAHEQMQWVYGTNAWPDQNNLSHREMTFNYKTVIEILCERVNIGYTSIHVC